MGLQRKQADGPCPQASAVADEQLFSPGPIWEVGAFQDPELAFWDGSLQHHLVEVSVLGPSSHARSRQAASGKSLACHTHLLVTTLAAATSACHVTLVAALQQPWSMPEAPR